MQSSVMNDVPAASITDRILEIIVVTPGCQMRHVARLLPDLYLREIVHTLRYLSNKGQLNLKVNEQEGVAITMSPRSFN